MFLKVVPAKQVDPAKPTSYAIQSQDNSLLGFVYFAGSASAGDCIVRSMPQDPNDIEAPSSKVLMSLQDMGEFSWAVRNGRTEVSSGGSLIASITNGELVVAEHRFSVVPLGHNT